MKNINSLPIFKLFNDVQGCTETEDILTKGGINFKVEAQDQHITIRDKYTGNTEKILNDRMVAVYRPSTRKILGTVGRGYGFVQNSDAVEFCRAFSQGGEAEFHSAVAPNLGETLFLLMKQPKWIDLGAGDKIHAYFCVTSTHDGRGCFRAIPLYLREVGQTVYTPPAVSSAFKFRHTKRVGARMAKAQLALSVLADYWSEYSDNVKKFASINVNDDQARDYFKIVYPGDSTRSENVRDSVFDIYKNTGVGHELPSCKDTLFGCMAAVSENADFNQTVKVSGIKDQVAARLHSRISGSAAETKAKAMHTCYKMAGFGRILRGNTTV